MKMDSPLDVLQGPFGHFHSNVVFHLARSLSKILHVRITLDP